MTFVFILSAVVIAIMFYWLGEKSGYSDGVDTGYWYGRSDGIRLAQKRKDYKRC